MLICCKRASLLILSRRIMLHISNLPVWVFLELIPLGTMLYFYRFCAYRFKSKDMQKNLFILLQCKNIHNACAHSDCILNDLHINTSRYGTSFLITQKLSHIYGLNRNIRANQMSNERIQGLISILFMHNKIATSKGVHSKQLKSSMYLKIVCSDIQNTMLAIH